MVLGKKTKGEDASFRARNCALERNDARHGGALSAELGARFAPASFEEREKREEKKRKKNSSQSVHSSASRSIARE